MNGPQFATSLHMFVLSMWTITDLTCLDFRPLPEEEELEDELFVGTSEEGDAGRVSRGRHNWLT